MSIDKRKDRAEYKLTFKGSKADFAALSDVLGQAAKRFDVDLYPNTKDIPGRISLTTGTAFQFSRVKRTLTALSEGLRNEDTSISIDIGDIDIREGIPGEPKDEYLAMMDAATDSKKALQIKGMGTPIYDAIRAIGLFEDRTFAEGGLGADPNFLAVDKDDPLSKSNMRWMYYEPLIGPEATAASYRFESMKAITGLDNYPPKLSRAEKQKFGKWAMKNKFDRAYIVLLEVDDPYSMSYRVYTRPGHWDKLITSLTAGTTILNKYEGKPPKTLGDIYLRIAAYATGKAFDMRNVAVMPFDISKMGTMPLVGPNDFEKIYSRKGVATMRRLAKDEEPYPVYRNFHAFLVVGNGAYKARGMTRAPEVEESLVFPDL